LIFGVLFRKPVWMYIAGLLIFLPSLNLALTSFWTLLLPLCCFVSGLLLLNKKTLPATLLALPVLAFYAGVLTQ
jgi:hypothetical protein